jgi:UV DNA damage repair endonuclease
MTKRIGFACKWIDHPHQVNGLKPKDDAKKYNTGSTTVAWLNRQSRAVAEEKLWDLVKGNIESTRLLVERVGSLDENLRMVRLSSDILPVYTEPVWGYFYRQSDVRAYCERAFKQVGNVARKNNVRLSFHPGQFVVLGSDRPDVVDRSIDEFEYHADVARWMGYGQKFQDFKINVHIAGRAGPNGVRQAYKRLSPEARNCITIENEEISYGLDDCLELADLVPIVLDINHAWNNEGKYIDRMDSRIDRVVESWRGIRPTFHYSQPRNDYLTNHSTVIMPNMSLLLDEGYKKQKLRAHSDFMWHKTMNEWAYTHWEWGDCMVECKSKNLGAHQLFEFWKQLENSM